MLGLDEKEETNEEAREKMMVKRAAWSHLMLVETNPHLGDTEELSTC